MPKRYSVLTGGMVEFVERELAKATPKQPAAPRPVFRINVTERDKDGRLVSLEVLQLENPNDRR
jgi:hypothetical protein